MARGLRFDDRVVLISGAGNGLGRAHALLFAQRGAKVVVNDLGGAATGGGSGQAAADRVVAEIVEAGGEAVANYDSVLDGDKLVQTALDTWGRLDVVVNNAGILRDKSFAKMSEDDWEKIYQVHLLGAFRLTHAAWPHLREQQYGRVIVTSSAAGIYGNFGQTNYSAAKLGLVGMANTLALEGHKRNVHVNAIAPLAASRLTEGLLPDSMFDALDPGLISPLVAWLCHEDCEETGGVFEVGGGFFGKLRWQRAAGEMMRLGRTITPERVRDSWDAIANFDDPTYPGSITESMSPIADNINAGPSKGGNEFVDVDQALGYRYPPVTTTYTPRDVAIYALGVGAAADPTDDAGLQLVYEGHGGGMRVLPTFGVIPVINGIIDAFKAGNVAPGLNYGLDRLLHGEQYTEVLRPMPPSGKLTHHSRIRDIFDKGKGALIVTETVTRDEDGDDLVKNVFTAFIRGVGGWGGDRGPKVDKNVPPEREPDAVVTQQTRDDQALLYRLSGDVNPLHVDPGFATAFGFDRPILHGLCTYGHAARHVIEAFCDGDPRLFKSIDVRFADSVFPGETLVTEMWKESDTRIVFRVKVAERDAEVITRAAVELYTEVPKKPEKAAPAAETAPSGPSAADVFRVIGDYVTAHPELVQSVGKVYQFALSNPDSTWTLDLKEGTVAEGATAKPECTLALADADFMDMTSGKADAMKLYMGGKLKISGDLMASQKLDFLRKIERPTASAAPAAPEVPAEPASTDVFVGIGVWVELHPELVERIGKVFAFELSEPDSQWTIDVKNAPGGVTRGAASADCTLALSEADFTAMTRGEIDPMKLYMEGRLKISGDLMASQKLSFLQEIDADQIKEAVAERKAAGLPAAAAAPIAEARAPALFAALAEGLEAVEGGPVLQFDVREPDGSWVVDRNAGAVREGTDDGAATRLLLSDADVAALASGSAEVRDLFQRGRLRVEGEIKHAHDLSFLVGLA